MQTLIRSLEKRSQSWVVGLGILLLVCVGVSNCISSMHVLLMPFYLFPVALVTWCLSRRAGLWMAGLSTVVQIGANLAGKTLEDYWLIPCWNAVITFGTLTIVVLLLSALRNLQDNLNQKISEETSTRTVKIDQCPHTEECHRTEKNWRSLCENLPHIVIMVDRNGTITFTNRMLPLLNVENMPGKSVYQYVLPEYHGIVRQCLARVFQSGKSDRYESSGLGPNGSTVWYETQVMPIQHEGRVETVLLINIDATERKRLEKEVLAISDQEQSRIGRDLHDGLCQELLAAAVAGKVLEGKLAARALAESADAREITQLINRTVGEVRDLARGLSPVPFEAEGLMAALSELAMRVERLTRLRCSFRCQPPVLISDNAVATHLFRITQEAVNNAIKHGQPQQIGIELGITDGLITLTICDDGVGLPNQLNLTSGMGLRLMAYRARVIGATLSVQRQANRGTVVACSLSLKTTNYKQIERSDAETTEVKIAPR